MIELSVVSAGYRGRAVVAGASLKLRPGTVTVLLGPNGCGKTTLLKTAARLLKPMAGRVLLDGRGAWDYAPRQFARRVSMLPQCREVPAITAEGLVLHGRFPYLGFPRRPSREDMRLVRRALEAAGAAAYADKYLSELSGGERQKVYFAMALAQDTETVLMDEPTTYLDIRHQLEMLALIDGLRRRGRAVAAVLHDLPQAIALADTICLMEEGRVVAVGPAEEVLRSGELERVFGVCCETLRDSAGRAHPVFYQTP